MSMEFAEKLRAQHNLTLGNPEPLGAKAPNGEPYAVLNGVGKKLKATKVFAQYRASRAGKILYWRTRPEFKRVRGQSVFYMRLLIADK